ncbi:uncharacterized abhydrolase domain-containing protein DDB_G0269086-like [Myxocyprinus asiaticus]|uniref:uncharacterized abhydrolase domain-containing protein DDB_G0269086-like n=1 Tax=Myxocyprinus asiaticus TaxID=70543 RepID=UPI002223DF6F|nr:uncharacterized abhydrolase domain-containing protein DDB_G0269086-like [Myxocyprinus asiaticus]
MEAAIKTVVGVYLKSAKGKENLGAKEFQNLVKNNLKNILTGTENNDAIKGMRQELDNNQDGKVSFQEYMKLIGYLAQAVSDQRCSDQEEQAASSSQEAQAEAAAAAVKAEPQQAEPAKDEEKKEEAVAEEAVAEKAVTEEQKPKEENKINMEQEGAKVEEKNKTEEAS